MDNKKTILSILGIGVIVLMFIGGIKFGEVFAFLVVFKYMINTLSHDAGMNIWLARMVSGVFAFFLVVSVFKMISFRRATRISGIKVFATLFFSTSSLMMFLTRDFNFDENGNPIRSVAMTPNGYEFVPTEWKAHKTYGTPTAPVTPEVIEQIDKYSTKETTVKSFVPSRRTRFFSNSGIPIVYYYEQDDGKLEFFKQSGPHPQLGAEAMLKPINKAVVERFLRYLDNGEFDMIVGNSGSVSTEGLSQLSQYIENSTN